MANETNLTHIIAKHNKPFSLPPLPLPNSPPSHGYISFPSAQTDAENKVKEVCKIIPGVSSEVCINVSDRRGLKGFCM